MFNLKSIKTINENLYNDNKFQQLICSVVEEYSFNEVSQSLAINKSTLKRWQNGITIPHKEVRNAIFRFVCKKILLKEIKNFCDINNIEFICDTENTHLELGDDFVNGYFSSEPPTLAVAIGKPTKLWLPILVHEYCHAQQFLDDPDWFNRCDSDIFFDWVAGASTMTQEEARAAAEAALRLEADCEARVVALINEIGLQSLIEPSVYAQKANAYITFYKFVLKHKKWYSPFKEPYNIEIVWSKFPTVVQLSGCDLTAEIEQLYIDNCI